MAFRFWTDTMAAVPPDQMDALVAEGWTVVSGDDASGYTLERQRQWTLEEELAADAETFLKNLAKFVLQAPPWPQNIDAFRTAFNPTDAANRYLQARGQNQANVPTATKLTLAGLIEIAMWTYIMARTQLPEEA